MPAYKASTPAGTGTPLCGITPSSASALTGARLVSASILPGAGTVASGEVDSTAVISTVRAVSMAATAGVLMQGEASPMVAVSLAADSMAEAEAGAVDSRTRSSTG